MLKSPAAINDGKFRELKEGLQRPESVIVVGKDNVVIGGQVIISLNTPVDPK